jgi:hypothetical protein
MPVASTGRPAPNVAAYSLAGGAQEERLDLGYIVSMLN